MKLRFDHILAVSTLVFWGAVAWVVIDYNLGFGVTTLKWPHPLHSTAAWTWDAREATPTTLVPKSGQWLRVTLPRGFLAGTLVVRTKQPSDFILRAEPKDSQHDIAQASQGGTHSLSFVWADLVARGKTYRFRLENPTDRAITIETISLKVTR